MQDRQQQSTAVFSYTFHKHDLTYRVMNHLGNRVAVCYLRETAELLTAALNAYAPARMGIIPGVLLPQTKPETP